uniref:Calcitonin gene-related peptide type 1 receptor n=1 Tax=Callorhinchus milii TaxID=7868 RepID=V9KRQ9_CALMI
MTHCLGESLTVWLLISVALTQANPVDITEPPPDGHSVEFLSISRGKIIAAQYECYLKMLRDEPTTRDDSYCKRTWDGWLCWDDSPAASISVQHCPDYFQDFNPNEEVTKICNADGHWFRHPISDRTWSNYTRCSTLNEDYDQKIWNLYYIIIIGNSLSIVSLLVALAIFFHCRTLSCQRVSLHKNLFLSYTLCAGVNLGHLSAIAYYPQLQDLNSVECKVVQFLHLYLIGCNYFWMLCEGIYLHTLIVVAVFAEKQHLLWYYLLGWGFPLIPATIHAIARSIYYNDNCWISSDTFLLYIIHGPICAALLVNLFFLLNIVRVLITKLKVTHRAESNLYMKAVRATLILVPLLGIQFVLFPWKPDGQNGEEVYEYVMHILMHYQGLLVATIFCFFNGEVQAILKRHWMQYKIQFGNSLSHSEGLRSTSCTGTSITEVQGGLYNHESNSDHLNGKNFNDIEPIGLKTGETYT